MAASKPPTNLRTISKPSASSSFRSSFILLFRPNANRRKTQSGARQGDQPTRGRHRHRRIHENPTHRRHPHHRRRGRYAFFHFKKSTCNINSTVFFINILDPATTDDNPGTVLTNAVRRMISGKHHPNYLNVQVVQVGQSRRSVAAKMTNAEIGVSILLRCTTFFEPSTHPFPPSPPLELFC